MPTNDVVRLPVHTVHIEDGWVHVTLRDEVNENELKP
jgi:hypothetical protein